MFLRGVIPPTNKGGIFKIREAMEGPGGSWVYYLTDPEGRSKNNYYYEYQLQKATPAQVILYGR